MRKYMESRYIPYIRTRYRETSGRCFQVRAHIQNALVFVRYIMCMVFLILTLCNIYNKYNNAASAVIENNIISIVNECIDNEVIKARKSFRENDFLIISKNRNGKVLSVKNDVIGANEFALALSENILSGLENTDNNKIKKNFGGIMENGILASFIMNAPVRIVPTGKVNVTPEFSMENAGENQKVHRLKMEISVKIKIFLPFHRVERRIERVFIVSETIIH
ncbi:MAG: hypothetical protein GX045_04015 [Clostridiaceae bacterium]|nr:hypothetical protein [Clostridiaceae bacterium]